MQRMRFGLVFIRVPAKHWQVTNIVTNILQSSFFSHEIPGDLNTTRLYPGAVSQEVEKVPLLGIALKRVVWMHAYQVKTLGFRILGVSMVVFHPKSAEALRMCIAVLSVEVLELLVLLQQQSIEVWLQFGCSFATSQLQKIFCRKCCLNCCTRRRVK